MMSAILVLGIFLVWSNRSINPVKTSISILVLSLIMFFTMSLGVGSTWIPILMAMLFMGGIIMMFMILSSVLPNEKSMKAKYQTAMLWVMLAAYFLSSWSCDSNATGDGLKSFLSSSSTFWVMMILILTYFISSMSVLADEQTPMRTMYCYYPLTL